MELTHLFHFYFLGVGRFTPGPVFDLSVNDCRVLGCYMGRSRILHWQIVICRERCRIFGQLLRRSTTYRISMAEENRTRIRGEWRGWRGRLGHQLEGDDDGAEPEPSTPGMRPSVRQPENALGYW